MKLLLVSVGHARYAVAADAVAGILDPSKGTDLNLGGLNREVTYRGSKVALVRLDTGQEESHPDRSRIFLVLEAAGKQALLPVDGAEAIRDVPATAIAPLPPFIFARQEKRFRGIFEEGGEPRLVLDVEGFL
jgi:chemotaxis protein histidine kinase CheA